MTATARTTTTTDSPGSRPSARRLPRRRAALAAAHRRCILIDGPSGRVTWVKVNDAQAGGLYSCLSGVLRTMQFPKIHGPRTRAEFDIAM